jgi:hypothetical protein
MPGEALIERALAGVAERRMPEVVGERQRLGQILVEPERAGERAGDLLDLERMGEAGAEMVALVEHEDLRLVGEPAEGRGVNDAVAIAPEWVAGWARRLPIEAPTAAPRVGRMGGAGSGGLNGHDLRPSLTSAWAALNYQARALSTGRRQGLWT